MRPVAAWNVRLRLVPALPPLWAARCHLQLLSMHLYLTWDVLGRQSHRSTAQKAPMSCHIEHATARGECDRRAHPGRISCARQTPWRNRWNHDVWEYAGRRCSHAWDALHFCVSDDGVQAQIRQYFVLYMPNIQCAARRPLLYTYKYTTLPPIYGTDLGILIMPRLRSMCGAPYLQPRPLGERPSVPTSSTFISRKRNS